MNQAELNKVNKQVLIKHLPAPCSLTCSGPKQQKNQDKLSSYTPWQQSTVRYTKTSDLSEMIEEPTLVNWTVDKIKYEEN